MRRANVSPSKRLAAFFAYAPQHGAAKTWSVTARALLRCGLGLPSARFLANRCLVPSALRRVRWTGAALRCHPAPLLAL